jgi:hypothetical protein
MADFDDLRAAKACVRFVSADNEGVRTFPSRLDARTHEVTLVVLYALHSTTFTTRFSCVVVGRLYVDPGKG